MKILKIKDEHLFCLTKKEISCLLFWLNIEGSNKWAGGSHAKIEKLYNELCQKTGKKSKWKWLEYQTIRKKP